VRTFSTAPSYFPSLPFTISCLYRRQRLSQRAVFGKTVSITAPRVFYIQFTLLIHHHSSFHSFPPKLLHRFQGCSFFLRRSATAFTCNKFIIDLDCTGSPANIDPLQIEDLILPLHSSKRPTCPGTLEPAVAGTRVEAQQHLLVAHGTVVSQLRMAMAEETMVMAAAVSVTVKAVAAKAVVASTVVKKGKFMSSSLSLISLLTLYQPFQEGLSQPSKAEALL
jgi:hypothetical protein